LPICIHLINIGHIAVIKILLEKGATVDIANQVGYTPLIMAALQTVLLENKDNMADVNQVDADGQSPLYVAAQNGRIEVVKILLKKGADVQKTSMFGYSPLMVAVKEGHIKVVQALLENKVVLADIYQTTTGYSPLFIAAEYGYEKIVEALLQKGANVNQANALGLSPLYVAAQNGHFNIVMALLEKGADVNQTDNSGVSPLILAAQLGDVDIVIALIEKKAHIDAENKAWVAALSDIKSTNPQGFEEIDKAIKNRKVQEAPKRISTAATKLAAESNRNKVVDVPSSNQENIPPSNINKPAITKASLQKAVEFIMRGKQAEFLEASTYKANEVVDNKGTTLLMLACQHGKSQIVEALLKDSKPNALDTKGENALFYALRCNDEDNRTAIVRNLIDNKIDMNVINKKGQTAQEFAKKSDVELPEDVMNDLSVKTSPGLIGG